MSGHYIETETDPWGRVLIHDLYFTPCGDGCASGSSTDPAIVSFPARLTNGQWTWDTVNDAACGDGTHVPVATSSHWTWDPYTLAGTLRSTSRGVVCGVPAGYAQINTFQLRQAP